VQKIAIFDVQAHQRFYQHGGAESVVIPPHFRGAQISDASQDLNTVLLSCPHNHIPKQLASLANAW